MTDGVFSASVGRGGVNVAADVAVVQNLLIARGFKSITSASIRHRREQPHPLDHGWAGFSA